MAKRIAVTGATGFIGTYLVEELLKRGNIVHPISREFNKVECDMIYHLACPSTTEFINNNPKEIMDIILDGTRRALTICPTAMFINASSYGAEYIDNTPQGAYNVAKRCMEIYLEHSVGPFGYINYRIPSVYGPNAPADSFVQRCIDGTAHFPKEPNKMHYIVYVHDLVKALADCQQIPVEEITLGQIYERFSKT
jgi:nucleoside-diphosphate-sugar epimerase